MLKGFFTSKITTYFPALAYKNFRIFITGLFISQIGTWVQNIGQIWLVLGITDSALLLGVVTAMQNLPMLLFSLLAGSLVDRFNKRKILIVIQCLFLVLATILAILAFRQVVQYWHIVLLAFLFGLCRTVDVPARQAMFIDLVGRDALMNAISMNHMAFQVGRVVGPALAGICISILGLAPCFLLNAVSYIPIALGFVIINLPENQEQAVHKNIFRDMIDGLTYVKNEKMILLPLVLMAVIAIFITNYQVVLPIYAKVNYGADPAIYGFLMTAMGIGALIGATLVATHSNRSPRFFIILLSGACAAVFLGLLGLEKMLHLAYVTLFLLGICHTVFMISVSTTIQLQARDTMRGRVMGIHSLVNGGAVPIGSLFSGQLIEVAGIRLCLMICAAIGLGSVVLTKLRLWTKGRLKTNKRIMETSKKRI
jgi:predicted MFS family arabinose efflux permease